jgi:hypothetical protein
MLPAGFEPTIPASERSQTHGLDRAVTGIGRKRSLIMPQSYVIRELPALF